MFAIFTVTTTIFCALRDVKAVVLSMAVAFILCVYFLSYTFFLIVRTLIRSNRTYSDNIQAYTASKALELNSFQSQLAPQVTNYYDHNDPFPSLFTSILAS